MSNLFKKIIAGFILISFLSIVFFSMPLMMHNSDGAMTENCPFSFSDVSLCPQNLVAATVHHVSMYNAFFNVQVAYNLIALIASLIVAILFAYISNINFSLFKRLAFKFSSYIPPPFSVANKRIFDWLSLLENSPSLY